MSWINRLRALEWTLTSEEIGHGDAQAREDASHLLIRQHGGQPHADGVVVQEQQEEVQQLREEGACGAGEASCEAAEGERRQLRRRSKDSVQMAATTLRLQISSLLRGSRRDYIMVTLFAVRQAHRL